MPLAGRYESAVIRSLRKAALPATDEAASKALRGVARLLDEAVGTEDEVAVVKDLMPQFRGLANDLGLTPAGRRVKGGKSDDNGTPGGNALAALIAERGPGTRVN